MTLVVQERVWGLCGTLGILQGSLMIQVGRRYWLDLVSGDKDSVSDVCGLSSWLRQGQWCSVICSTCLAPASTADPSLGSACPSLSISGLKSCPVALGTTGHLAVATTAFPADCQAAPLATFPVLDLSMTHEHRGWLRSATSGFPPNSTTPSLSLLFNTLMLPQAHSMGQSLVEFQRQSRALDPLVQASPQALAGWRVKTRIPDHLLWDLCRPLPALHKGVGQGFHFGLELLFCRIRLLPWGSKPPSLAVIGRNSFSIPWKKPGAPARLCSGFGSYSTGRN